MKLGWHGLPRIAVKIGIHTVTVLRFNGDCCAVTAIAAHHFGHYIELGTHVDIAVFQIRLVLSPR